MLDSLHSLPVQEGVDLQPMFFRLTLNTTTDVLFGRASGTDTSINTEADKFADAFNDAQHILARRGRLGDFYFLIGGAKFRKDCRTAHAYVDEIVNAALIDDQAGKENSSKYIFLKALMNRTKDPKALRDQLINVLLAGRDTTACCLQWTL